MLLNKLADRVVFLSTPDSPVGTACPRETKMYTYTYIERDRDCGGTCGGHTDRQTDRQPATLSMVK